MAVRDNATVPEAVTGVWEEYYYNGWVANPRINVTCTSMYNNYMCFVCVCRLGKHRVGTWLVLQYETMLQFLRQSLKYGRNGITIWDPGCLIQMPTSLVVQVQVQVQVQFIYYRDMPSKVSYQFFTLHTLKVPEGLHFKCK